jgi:hypothetical protein
MALMRNIRYKVCLGAEAIYAIQTFVLLYLS